MAYRILQTFLRLVVSVFFRNIEVVGREKIPKEGAIIFAGNHPNSLMDPVLVITHSGKKVHFAAKDVLFKSRFLRIFLRTLGAVPIMRKQDHDGNIDNKSTFVALFKVLEQGGCMGIFPEGISHMNSELARLKTGTARIAFESRDPQKEQAPLHIVPVGLTYLHRQRFRSQVLIHFGDPITIDDERIAAYEEAPKQKVRELTDQLDQQLRALTINASDWDTLRTLHTARRLYKPADMHLDLGTYAELMRRFTEGYERGKDDPEVMALRQQLEAYQSRLDQLGLQDHDLRNDRSLAQIFSRFLGRCFYLLILLPLAIPGFVLHLPIMFSAIVAGDYLTARKDVVATTKLISSILLVPLMYLAIAALVWWLSASPIAALVVLGLLPLSGFATIRVLEQQFAVGRSLKALTQIVRYHQEMKVLRELRVQLIELIEHAVQRLHNPEVPRLIPKAGGEEG